MKIMVYCQHVLGLGHFFRTLEIINALKAHQVILVTGGDRLPVPLPGHVTGVRLPGLMMDAEFNSLYSVDPDLPVETVKSIRRDQLLNLVDSLQPDLFVVELYPFGRNGFRFELLPVIERIKSKKYTKCPIICSVRDILVEKSDPETYEKRVVNLLNQWFDGVMVHADPNIISLETTFSSLGDVKIPVVYTGYVTPLPDLATARNLRQAEGIGENQQLIIISAGSGVAGWPLLRAAAMAHSMLKAPGVVRMKLITGPYMVKEEKEALKSFEGDQIRISSFSSHFVSLLAASELSVSMAGYNTVMNLLAARVPALVWPFSQNREQLMRVEKFARRSEISLLSDDDIRADRLAGLMDRKLKNVACRFSTRECGKPSPAHAGVDLNGALYSASWLEGLVKK